MKHFRDFRRFLKPLAFLLVCIAAFSFKSIAGGDMYSIYLNKELIFKYYVHSKQNVDIKTLQFTEANKNDELTIYYSHCGKTGQSRSISLRDQQGNVLKTWKFDDGTPNGAMVIPVKEILALEKGSSLSIANLVYYSAVELPKGQMLAPVKMTDAKAFVQPKQEESAGSNGELFTFSALSLLVSAASLYKFSAK